MGNSNGFYYNIIIKITIVTISLQTNNLINELNYVDNNNTDNN